jgi:L-fuculose-phosphate aldolase
MPKTEQEYRHEIVRICRLAYEKGWVAANDGNASVRLEENRILCMPAAISNAMVEAGELMPGMPVVAEDLLPRN